MLESGRREGTGSIYKKLSQSGKVTVITGSLRDKSPHLGTWKQYETNILAGGARGIGLTLAEATAELGGNVALLDRMEPQTDLARFKTIYGTEAKFYR